MEVRKLLLKSSFKLLCGLFLVGTIGASFVALAQDPPAAPAADGAAAGADTIDPKEATKQLETLSDELFLQGLMDAFDYKPRQRRDPFFPPVLDQPVSMGARHGPLVGLQKFDLSSLKLIGIVWDVKRPRAMISDPLGKVHVVGPNAKIGLHNGYIAVIREGEIVVVETMEGDAGRLTTTAQVVKLAK